ncbi:MAG: UDP-N-acetylmuramoyl-L-alanine--D-glutamate ligase [Ignavibacteriaceae bacterium]|nr:UDP-N-acetylmuramoyl-L-alanine--D-glutamate ligase [Ignavibacteriaceae bacterium]
MDLKNKNITVIGARKSGIGAAKLIQHFGGIPFVSDSNSEENLIEYVELLKKEKISFELGGHSGKIYSCDMFVVSPGVPSDAKIILEAKQRGLQVISELELAYHFCKGKIIAITGTNGKTTTTSLCEHVFNKCGIKTYAAGNIGVAFSEIVTEVKENDVVSLEVSSFQLDLIDKFKPQMAMILNITPDHLNRYQNKLENYINSKLRIYKNQTKDDFLILNKDNLATLDIKIEPKSRVFYFSLTKEIENGCYCSNDFILFKENGKELFKCSLDDINLKGEHNYANAMSVIIAAKIMGLDNKKIKSALSDFKGVEHRLEFVREINGVKFINDSKATNIDSVWYALRSFNNPIFLILGGQDKGNDYNQIKKLVNEKVKKIYAIGSSAEKIFNFFHSMVKVEMQPTLESAVAAANKEARENDIVLFSPACASFDMFRNYEHRGIVFKEAVNKL